MDLFERQGELEESGIPRRTFQVAASRPPYKLTHILVQAPPVESRRKAKRAQSAHFADHGSRGRQVGGAWGTWQAYQAVLHFAESLAVPDGVVPAIPDEPGAGQHLRHGGCSPCAPGGRHSCSTASHSTAMQLFCRCSLLVVVREPEALPSCRRPEPEALPSCVLVGPLPCPIPCPVPLQQRRASSAKLRSAGSGSFAPLSKVCVRHAGSKGVLPLSAVLPLEGRKSSAPRRPIAMDMMKAATA